MSDNKHTIPVTAIIENNGEFLFVRRGFSYQNHKCSINKEYMRKLQDTPDIDAFLSEDNIFPKLN